ncbi:MAG: hypothetical protein JWM00_224 [Candidatus Saccharibacteria bacterium]|nr:hypothetical protein [Candidatus Saccharibacteria bacterium]
MNFFRTILIWLARLVCVLAVSGTVSLLVLQTTLLDRTDVKQWLKASGLYDSSLISALFPAESTQVDIPTVAATSQELVSNEAVKAALQRTFTTDFIQSGFESVIDNSYDWMEGKRATFAFSVPVDSKRDTFIAELIKEVEPRVAALPPCGVVAQSLCRPAPIPPADFTRQIVTDSIGQSDFLKAPITQTMFAAASQQQDTTSLSELPRLRSAVAFLLYLLPVLFCVAALGGALLSLRGTRLQFFIKLSRGVFSNMILAVVIAGVVLLLDRSGALPIEQLLGQSNPLAPFIAHFITQMITGIAWTLLLIAGITLVISTGSWIALSIIKKRRPAIELPPNPSINAPHPAPHES